ncbi:MAG: PAS domain-containing protein [Lachnospiraceae bacterium]|nr:PAS domain-containing protein [Lachnospiraceae bacterium]
MKQVVTSDEKRFFRNENKGGNSAFDLGSLYDRLPAGIIGCMDNPLLTVQMLNPIMLTVLEYESLEELKEYTGTSLYSLIHPDDLQKMRDFVEAVKSAGSREILTIRIRKKDFSYAWLQLTGDLFQKDLFIFLGMLISLRVSWKTTLLHLLTASRSAR